MDKTKTFIYGCSDDLIEIDGALSEELNVSNKTLAFSDGTIASIKYGEYGLWRITVRHKGLLFERLALALGEDVSSHNGELAEMPGYSDVLILNGKPEWVATIGKIMNPVTT